MTHNLDPTLWLRTRSLLVQREILEKKYSRWVICPTHYSKEEKEEWDREQKEEEEKFMQLYQKDAPPASDDEPEEEEIDDIDDETKEVAVLS
jgi:hypothetical protein